MSKIEKNILNHHPIRGKNLTKQQKKAIERLYTSMPPTNIVKISKKLHISTQRVYDYLKSLGIVREPSKAILLSLHGDEEWRKLTPVSKEDGNARILSIPPNTLEKAGLSVHKDIYGKWKVVGERKVLLELINLEKSQYE